MRINRLFLDGKRGSAGSQRSYLKHQGKDSKRGKCESDSIQAQLNND